MSEVDALVADPSDEVSAAELLGAVRPLLDRIGARLVDPAELDARDVPLHWRGAVVAGVRLPGPVTGEPAGSADGGSPAGTEDADLGGLAGILASVERQFDEPLADLPRPDKQRAVRLLEEAGAFSYRKAVETVAGALGVSRFTVYNYLNRERA
ncbi:transcriptional regulator [Nakamurella flava]|uniref:Transcriptional regulator n=1 Tax=Nakamurella flava TaxID=2576308 RepID=A0A4V6CRT9_9ACTN|nr:helix-turn-helix domain-containing protein [Nakamurella flava]TKV58855.1 transcriptional regulator [Nakamurella flava]